MKFVTSAVLLATALSAHAENKVIYGNDDRLDLRDVTSSAVLELAKATAAMIPNENIRKPFLSSTYKLKTETLRERGMCASERFAAQPTAANCSGFLISDRLVVTAGHCVRLQSDCADNKWVFDYALNSAGDTGFERIQKSQIFSCKRIVKQVLDSTKNDFAILELDRAVTDRRPLNIRRAGKPAVGEPMMVIGHPTGLPTKVAGGASVRADMGVYFQANLDTYGGNSGSAVINVNTHEVEGILVRGDTDYQYAGGCQASVIRANEGGRGEDVTYITNLVPYLSL